jgi:hypothetical protein
MSSRFALIFHQEKPILSRRNCKKKADQLLKARNHIARVRLDLDRRHR